MGKKSVPIDTREFWNAHPEAFFDQKVIGAVLGFSTSWMERKRWEGGGIPYIKLGHKCMYRKSDVLEWLEKEGLKKDHT